MKNISHKISEFVETRSFEELSAIEQEMVLSEMSEEDYNILYENLERTKGVFEEERALIVPDVSILANLKGQLTNDVEEEQVRSVFWFSRKISLFKSAAAVLLAILGSYVVFGKTESRVEYIVQEKIVEKKVYDTVYNEKLVEVPVERIVKVVEYKTRPNKKQPKQNNVLFTVRELENTSSNESIELDEFTKSYGNSKIRESDLEQFRVSL